MEKTTGSEVQTSPKTAEKQNSKESGVSMETASVSEITTLNEVAQHVERTILNGWEAYFEWTGDYKKIALLTKEGTSYLLSNGKTETDKNGMPAMALPMLIIPEGAGQGNVGSNGNKTIRVISWNSRSVNGDEKIITPITPETARNFVSKNLETGRNEQNMKKLAESAFPGSTVYLDGQNFDLSFGGEIAKKSIGRDIEIRGEIPKTKEAFTSLQERIRSIRSNYDAIRGTELGGKLVEAKLTISVDANSNAASLSSMTRNWSIATQVDFTKPVSSGDIKKISAAVDNADKENRNQAAAPKIHQANVITPTERKSESPEQKKHARIQDMLDAFDSKYRNAPNLSPLKQNMVNELRNVLQSNFFMPEQQLDRAMAPFSISSELGRKLGIPTMPNQSGQKTLNVSASTIRRAFQ